MYKSLLIKICILTGIVFSFSIPAFAFEGNEQQTQTLIVTSQILDEEGKLIDPEGDSKANQDIFTITVHFSNLDQDADIRYANGIFSANEDGTAEVTFETGNCAPQYFDNVPVTAKITVTEYTDSYQISYQAYDFISNADDYTEKDHTSLTTKELQLQEGKDGFVLFSNKKSDLKPETTATHRKGLAAVILILVFLMAVILLYKHRNQNE